MTRSHPPTLIRLAQRTLLEECGVMRGERVLVAVSGGGDSAALLHVLSVLAPDLGISLVAHGIDHGLRTEAGAELDMAEALAKKCDIPFGRTAVRVTRGGNVQARARDARRAALEKAASAVSAQRIATAHHMNDRAETVLIRLLAGAHPGALAVLPAADGRWVRPLIRAQKRDVLLHLARHRLEFAEDPSNRDPRFLRVSVRSELLPLMEKLSPRIVHHLATLADEAASAGRSDPAPVDDSGNPLHLKRSQAEAIRRARRLGQSIVIRLSGNRELHVEPQTGRLHVGPAEPLTRGRRGQGGEPSEETATKRARRPKAPKNVAKFRRGSEKGGAK